MMKIKFYPNNIDVDVMDLLPEFNEFSEEKEETPIVEIETRLVCMDFSEEIDDLVFSYQHKTKRYGRCRIKKAKRKQKETCELCGENIEENYFYYPYLWDRVVNHTFCAGCYWKSYTDWVNL